MLTGSELVSLVEANPECTQDELAEAAGYVKIVGERRTLQSKAFVSALLKAKGVKIAEKKKKRGKVVPFKTSVHKSGIILLGKRYSEVFEMAPGDELEIELVNGAIQLKPTGRNVQRRQGLEA